jgi:hypothetical protein
VALQICNLLGLHLKSISIIQQRRRGTGKQYSLYTHPMMTGV